MARNSALARVIGITKSFSPLSFDRSRDDRGGRENNVLPANFAPAMGNTLPLPLAPVPAVILDAADEAAADRILEAAEAAVASAIAVDAGSIVTPFPALAQVTVVAQEAEAEAGGEAETEDDEQPHNQAEDEMIEAIQRNITSLFAADESSGVATDDLMPEAPMWGDADDEGKPAQERMLALLGELDRMWATDPQVASQRG